MPRPKGPGRTQVLIRLPDDLNARLVLHLFSDLEGRVPYGAQNEFFISRTREFFEEETLDLEPFGLPRGYFVRGPKEAIEALKQSFTKETT